jgi:hypothetical protein
MIQSWSTIFKDIVGRSFGTYNVKKKLFSDLSPFRSYYVLTFLLLLLLWLKFHKMETIKSNSSLWNIFSTITSEHSILSTSSVMRTTYTVGYIITPAGWGFLLRLNTPLTLRSNCAPEVPVGNDVSDSDINADIPSIQREDFHRTNHTWNANPHSLHW